MVAKGAKAPDSAGKPASIVIESPSRIRVFSVEVDIELNLDEGGHVVSITARKREP